VKKLYSAFLGFILDEDGVRAFEYALIASLIAVVIIAAVRLVGQDVNNTFQAVANAMS
jgi:pilus assembly protein Flp/PilA